MKTLVAAFAIFSIITSFIWPVIFIDNLLEYIKNAVEKNDTSKPSNRKAMIASLFFMSFPPIIIILLLMLKF